MVIFLVFCYTILTFFLGGWIGYIHGYKTCEDLLTNKEED